MKIKKIKSQGEFVYPATIAAAVKDANFLKEDNKPMTQGEINLYLNGKTNGTSALEMDAVNFQLKVSPYIGQKTSDYVFACVPDMHTCFEFMTNNHLQFIKYADRLNGQCTLYISSGDILFSGNTSITKAQIISNYMPKYATMVEAFATNGIAFASGIGGHDFNFYNRVGNLDKSVANNLTKEEQRTYLIQPCVDAINNNMSSIYEAVISEDTNVCYYYVKNKITGHITVILDECDHPYTISNDELVYDVYSTVCYSQAQLRWVEDILYNLPEGKYVSFHNHMGIVGSVADIAGTCAELKKIITKFINRQEYSAGNGSDSNGFSWSTVDKDFTGCKGMFAGLFKGHNHIQEYSKIDNTIHQIGSTNPDGYPFGTSAYCYNQLYSGDVYVIRNQEIRNFHYGRTSIKDGGSGVWLYNKFKDRWIDAPLIISNNIASPELDDDSWEIVQELNTIIRTQTSKYYFAIPANGQLLGDIYISSAYINAMPTEISQYTLSEGSYTPTGGNYITKGMVEYDQETGILTIHDDGTIVPKTNGYILIGYYTNDATAKIVKPKEQSGTSVLNTLKTMGCSKVEEARTTYPTIVDTIEAKQGLLFNTATVDKVSGTGTATKGAIIRTGIIPEYTDTIEISFSTLSTVDGNAKCLFGTRSNGTAGNSFTTYLIANKIRADYDNPTTTSDTGRYTIVSNTHYVYTRCKDGDTLNGSDLKAYANTSTGEYSTSIPMCIGAVVSSATDYSNSTGQSNGANFLTNTIVHSFGIKDGSGNYKIYLVACADNSMIDLVSGNVFTCDEANWSGYYYNTAPLTTV